MSEEQKVNLLEVEVNKISLQPGDVLLAKVKGPDFKNEEVCEALKHSLKQVFPNNKVGVLFLEDNQIDFTVISQETGEVLKEIYKSEESSCNTGNYCVDCNCGKKEKYGTLPSKPLRELPEEEKLSPEELDDILKEDGNEQ